VQAAREDPACHGLISVGMLGEGLDLPYLHIAVLHRPYQSFPITLQFVGRVCRMCGQYERSAKLLAIPHQVEQHTRALYESDVSWSDLIAEISDAAVDQERERRHFAAETWLSNGPDRRVSIHTLRPSFAVTVYRVNPEHVDLNTDPKLPSGTRLVESFHSVDRSWRVLITNRDGRPTWSTSDAIVDSVYELTISDDHSCEVH
jgi:superfamily II DNA or RNA helicase